MIWSGEKKESLRACVVGRDTRHHHWELQRNETNEEEEEQRRQSTQSSVPVSYTHLTLPTTPYV